MSVIRFVPILFWGISTTQDRWFQTFFFSSLFGEDSHFDEPIFQMAWFKPPTRYVYLPLVFQNPSTCEEVWMEPLKAKFHQIPGYA